MSKRTPPGKKPEMFEWVPNGSYRKTRPASMVGRVAEIIQGADEVAIASSFLLADNRIEHALADAHWGQKRCYVMMAAASRLRQDIGNEFDRMAHDRHIETLKGIAGKALVRSSDDFHAKIVLADPGSDEPRGLFLTANLATEGLERNQELFVELEPDEIREAESVLRWAFWERSAHELAGDKLRDCKPLGKIKPVESKKILQTEPHHTIKRKIMEILDGRPKKIIVASFGWDAGHAVVEKLCGLSRQGTSVTVLTRSGRKSTYAALVKMKRANIRILGFSWFHAKAIISDSHTLVMSANIGERGLEKGFELGLTLEGERAEKVKKTVSGWIDNYQYEFEAGGPAIQGPPGTPAASGADGRSRNSQTPTNTSLRPAIRGPPGTPAASGADGAEPEQLDAYSNLQMHQSSNCCNLFYDQDKHGKEPDMSNIRLVKVLTGEDGIGGGISDMDGIQMAATKGKIIVADTKGRQLKVFDGNGVFVRSIACKKSEYGKQISPGTIALDSQNRIIVTDGSSIHTLDPSGVSIGEFDAENRIERIQTTSQDNIIVGCGNELHLFDSTGKPLDNISTQAVLFFGKNHVLGGGIWACTLYDFTVMNPKERASKVWEEEDMLEWLHGVDDLSATALDDKGHIYVAVNRSVHVLDLSGKVIKRITYDGVFAIEHMVALDHNRMAISGYDGTSIWHEKKWHHFNGGGRILSASNEGVVVQYDNCVSRLVPPSTVRTLLYKASGIQIATDSMDRIIVADHGCVKILNPDGSVVENIVDADGRGGRFGVIKAVAIDRQSRIVVRDGDHIRVFDSNGKFVQSFTECEYSAKVDARLAEFLDSYPYLAYDSHGRAVVALKNGGMMMSDRDEDIKGIAAPDTNALTVDRWDRIIAAHDSSITIYDHSGRLVNSVHGRYIRADGVAADGAGRIIVSGRDPNDNGMIQIFDTVPHGADSAEDPLRILKARYAKGEITDKQFEAMKKRLAQGS